MLPLAVHGTSTALKPHDWRQGHSDAEVRVLAPVSTEGMTMDDLPELKSRVRAEIVEALRSMGRDFGDDVAP